MDNIAVYRLSFSELPNMYYIGCSTRVNARKREHIKQLKLNKHSNYKLQLLYNVFQNINFNILEYTCANTLYEREKFWIDKLNSYKNGFNLTAGGTGIGQGHNHPSASLDKEQYKGILYLLVYSTLTLDNIADRFNIAETTVRNIRNLYAHTWLEEECPTEYKMLKDKYYSIKDYLNREIPKIVSTDGTIFEIKPNRRQFALAHKLDPSRLCKLLNELIPEYRGYKIYNESYNKIS